MVNLLGPLVHYIRKADDFAFECKALKKIPYFAIFYNMFPIVFVGIYQCHHCFHSYSNAQKFEYNVKFSLSEKTTKI